MSEEINQLGRSPLTELKVGDTIALNLKVTDKSRAISFLNGLLGGSTSVIMAGTEAENIKIGDNIIHASKK